MKGTEAYARLRIISDVLSPEEISRLVGMEPDRSWRKGETGYMGRRNSTMPDVIEKNSGWVVYSRLSRSELVETQVEELLERVRPYAGRIRTLSKSSDVVLSCAIYAHEEWNLELYVGNHLIHAIGALGADFWIDTYFLAGEDER
ncbi:MAG: DUF4279 domain-containing protein [Rubrobacteraceae bacterium]